jgi:hypothetical protein
VVSGLSPVLHEVGQAICRGVGQEGRPPRNPPYWRGSDVALPTLAVIVTIQHSSTVTVAKCKVVCNTLIV